ncbi:hypothetical protein [Amycolatopsis thermoflava]|uniref:hypothetical protein n=1 Tax=Amycolatopsis thermoflava TaxID=84480 RepID=UPI0012FCCA00|nr:hypothetical protein [Amycolatopsis thermoflava]
MRQPESVRVCETRGVESIREQAISLDGMVLVTANPAHRARELEYALRQSGAVRLVHADAYRGRGAAGDDDGDVGGQRGAGVADLVGEQAGRQGERGDLQEGMFTMIAT